MRIPVNTSSNGPAGRMLAVASGKGGVGKTVLSSALASAFSGKGEQTLLIDGDLGMANIDVQLGLQPDADLAAVLAGEVLLEDAVQRIMGGAIRAGGFDVISGRSGSGALSDLKPEAVGKLAAGVAALSLYYDRAILDLAAGADHSTMRLAMAADDVLIVINDEPTSLTDAYAFVKTLRRRDDSAAPLVVVNNAPSQEAALSAYGAFRKTCESFLGFTPQMVGSIAHDMAIPDSIRAQMPLAQRHPNCEAFRDVEKLAGYLAQGQKAA